MVSTGRWRWKDGRFVRSLILLEKFNRTDECKNDEDEQGMYELIDLLCDAYNKLKIIRSKLSYR